MVSSSVRRPAADGDAGKQAEASSVQRPAVDGDAGKQAEAWAVILFTGLHGADLANRAPEACWSSGKVSRWCSLATRSKTCAVQRSWSSLPQLRLSFTLRHVARSSDARRQERHPHAARNIADTGQKARAAANNCRQPLARSHQGARWTCSTHSSTALRKALQAARHLLRSNGVAPPESTRSFTSGAASSRYDVLHTPLMCSSCCAWDCCSTLLDAPSHAWAFSEGTSLQLPRCSTRASLWCLRLQ
mmetsp:Transcript_26872/g.52624  ORF Transcript_26872/g.52624 Transcript_26872/m.52624 type:complete len:246 (-) Transcript_26872:171-908(-)